MAVAAQFRDLVVYRRSCLLADRVRSQVVDWPSLDKWTLGLQLVRAADSIGANIAEAYGREPAAGLRTAN